MRVLLIFPEYPDTFWSLRSALRFVRKQSVMPPLGLITVAAMFPADWEVRLVDTNVTPLTHADLAWAEMAFISAMGVQRDAARRIIHRCRAAHVPIVAGGPLFTAEPEAFPEVDHLVLNEGEITFPRFLEDLQKGTPQRVYASGEFADLHHSPAPRWELLDLRRYFSMGIQYSRGCPFNCEFCNVTTLFGRVPRTKSPTQIINELDRLHNAGWRESVFFVDDNLIGNKKLARTELLPALIDWQGARGHQRVNFNTQASINMADDPTLLSLMAEAGFDTVFIGIETPNAESLAETGKTQNRRRDMIADVQTIHRAGIQVQGGFIVGFDHDDSSIFQRQIDFIQRSGVVTAMVGLLNALPGTALFTRLRNEGRLRGDSTGDNVDGTTNIVPAMGLDRLVQGYRQILHAIYARRAYYRRVRTFLRAYRVPRVRTPISTARVAAFLRSILFLGVLGRERLQYWYLLFWTLVRRPRSFPYAVTMSIYGAHFLRMCNRELGVR